MSMAAIVWVFVMPGAVCLVAGIATMITSQDMHVQRTKGRHRR